MTDADDVISRTKSVMQDMENALEADNVTGEDLSAAASPLRGIIDDIEALLNNG